MATEAEKKLLASLKIDPKRGLMVSTQLATLRAATYDLEIEAGRDWSLPISWLDGDDASVRDLTGYTAKLQIRSYPGATAQLSLTESAGITLAATEPNITVAMTDTQTAALTISRSLYDLVLTSAAGVSTRILEGCVAVRKRVSI